jgi:hypothetical protein
VQLLCAYHFGFVIYWQKDFGAKATHKMLVKLTSGRKLLPLACHPTKKVNKAEELTYLSTNIGCMFICLSL